MTSPSGGSVPLNPDGTPNFQQLLNAGGSTTNTSSGSSKVPVDSSGAISVWNLPQWILDYEKTNSKPFVWASRQPSNIDTSNPAFNNRQFRQANDLPQSDSSGDDLNVNVSAEDLMKQFAAMAYNDPSNFRALQEVLAEGPWDSSMKVTGVFDAKTEAALATAMGQYLKTSRGASVPVKFSDFLAQSAQQNQANNPGGGSGTASSRPQLTDPDTLSMYAQRAAQAALGRSLSSSEINAFIDSFHKQQQDSFADALHGNGPVVDKNDPRASAIQFVTSQHAQEFQQHEVQGYVDSFLNMFLSGPSAAPNMNVDPSAVSY